MLFSGVVGPTPSVQYLVNDGTISASTNASRYRVESVAGQPTTVTRLSFSCTRVLLFGESMTATLYANGVPVPGATAILAGPSGVPNSAAATFPAFDLNGLYFDVGITATVNGGALVSAVVQG